ncbi:acetyl-CoA C-acyltransferase [Pseudomonas sp. CC6-YY-74]|uniref:acetyl-CoA C-acyltransferase n=1 Tax=Pseudomonas sp. CC6-YY-74 TaxID=1930532 RepID=UPI0009A170D1|nr:acetyl-CoA C-acyltransferase [Pseudomonas sp. CC6-YY-74]
MTTEYTPVLLDGIRTPFGKLGGALAGLSGRQLNAIALKALLKRQPELVECDGVLLGQVLQAAQGQNPARLAAVDAGVASTVPAATMNSVCLAGLGTVADAARRIRLGEGKAFLVGGGDSMSRAPHTSLLRPGVPRPGSLELVDTLIRDGLWCSLTDEGMGDVSERANQALGISRVTQDDIALRSQRLASQAVAAGRLREEIIPITIGNTTLEQDEGIRANISAERLAKLKPAFVAGGSITAGNASQMSDGASVGALTSLAYAEALGREPLARIVAFAEVAGPDNTLHLKPAFAVERALDRAGLRLSDIDLFEINEAFAAVVAASCSRLSIPIDVVNVNGGAIAIGHPLGGTGFRLLLTLAHQLVRQQARYGVACMCGGGGQGFAVIIERMKR